MKWWGWGHPDVSFPMHERPKLWPWIESKLGAKHEAKDAIIELDKIILNQLNLNPGFMQELSQVLPAENILWSHEERVSHSYGKSYPDLLRIRKGIIKSAPDVVVYPQSHEEVLSLVQLAVKYHVKLIPFGGGTNIVGALEVKDQSSMNVSVDMRKMKRLLKIDEVSQRATIEAGILGPELEEELNK